MFKERKNERTAAHDDVVVEVRGTLGIGFLIAYCNSETVILT